MLFLCMTTNGLRLGVVADFGAQKFNRRTELEPTTKLSYEALHPPLRQTAVSSRPSVCPQCKSLSPLSFIVSVVLVCVVAYFLFSEGEEIFCNSILSGWERWKLFCKLWSMLGLVRLANVLAPVSGIVILFILFSIVVLF